ncbi:MAG: cache domain-containing protein [Candidatus Omnitrophica bacterium]|nr:cache domain-containing protein [Candidatus Omnitrophota bacterium]
MASPTKSSAVRPPPGWPIPWWLLELYRKPAIFLSLVLALPVTIVCVWVSTANEQLWRAQAERHLIVASQLAGRVIQEELAQTRQLERAFASRPDFIGAVRRRDRASLTEDLRLLLQLLPMVDRAVVVDAAGRPLASAANSSRADAAREEGEPVGGANATWEPMRSPVSGVYLRDADSGEKAVGVATPVRDGAEQLGMVQVQYRVDEIARWLTKIRPAREGYLYVVDHQGLLIAHPLQLLPGAPKNVAAWPPVAADVTAEAALVRFTQGRPARPWTAAVVLVDPYGWRVISQQPDASLLRPFRRLVCSFLLVIAALAALLAGLVLRWSSLHRATLHLLAQQARLLKWSERRHLLATLRRAPARRRGTRSGSS